MPSQQIDANELLLIISTLVTTLDEDKAYLYTDPNESSPTNEADSIVLDFIINYLKAKTKEVA
jgi:hypothetical protein